MAGWAPALVEALVRDLHDPRLGIGEVVLSFRIGNSLFGVDAGVMRSKPNSPQQLARRESRTRQQC